MNISLHIVYEGPAAQPLTAAKTKDRDLITLVAEATIREAFDRARLADESIYSDPDRKDEMTRLVQNQAAAKSAIEALEWEWLEASESLERAT